MHLAYQTMLRFGIKNILEQSRVFNPTIYFRMLSLTSTAELQRMPQFKAAAKEQQTSHLLTYPVLMAHDIIGYEKVYVGEDQVPHIDFARKIIKRFNQDCKINFSCPEAVICGKKIMDLQDSSKKMSKSNPKGCLFLDDEPNVIASKIKGAVTDSGGVANLDMLYKEFVGGAFPESFGHGKTVLAEAITERMRVEQSVEIENPKNDDNYDMSGLDRYLEELIEKRQNSE